MWFAQSATRAQVVGSAAQWQSSSCRAAARSTGRVQRANRAWAVAPFLPSPCHPSCRTWWWLRARCLSAAAAPSGTSPGCAWPRRPRCQKLQITSALQYRECVALTAKDRVIFLRQHCHQQPEDPRKAAAHPSLPAPAPGLTTDRHRPLPATVGPLARRKYATLRPGAVETKGGGTSGGHQTLWGRGWVCRRQSWRVSCPHS